jgi:voltage-gated potassium channel
VSVLGAAGWVLWSVFVAELLLRAHLARDQRQFWSRNWWQLVFLAVPFLRFARVVTALRAARVGAVVGAAVRGSRSAGRVLSNRVWWLAIVTVIVVLAGSQLLYAMGSYDSYGRALHAAALAAALGAFFLRLAPAAPTDEVPEPAALPGGQTGAEADG